jgi:hypothetical protein
LISVGLGDLTSIIQCGAPRFDGRHVGERSRSCRAATHSLKVGLQVVCPKRREIVVCSHLSGENDVSIKLPFERLPCQKRLPIQRLVIVLSRDALRSRKPKLDSLRSPCSGTVRSSEFSQWWDSVPISGGVRRFCSQKWPTC